MKVALILKPRIYQQQIMANQEVKSVKSRDLRKPTPASKFYLHGFHVTVPLNFTPSSLARKVLAKWHWPLTNKAIATKNY